VIVAITAIFIPPVVLLPYTTVVTGKLFGVGLALIVSLLWMKQPVRFALGITAVLIIAQQRPGLSGHVLYTERTFFGTHQVIEANERHILFHGTTSHGSQSTRPERECQPLTYYTRSGPLGQLFDSFVGPHAKERVASIGLGAATVAVYMQPFQAWTFFEIDPTVKRIAEDPRYFTYLKDCAPGYQVILGDARLEVARLRDRAFDLMIFDAFSSDAIPVHLVTREALTLYLQKLAPGGVLAFHISNRHLDLSAPLGNLARDASMAAFIERDTRVTPLEARDGKYPSIWVVMARRREDFGDLLLNPQWQPAPVSDRRVWTDDYSNLVSVIRWPWRH